MTQPHTNSIPLGDGLTLRPVSSPADVQRYIDLNAAVTDEGDIAARLLHHHPATDHADYFLVVDEAAGVAASTTCLIPWRCTFDGVELKIAMLEMVVTDPAYRRRGLVRTQIEHFHRVAEARGFDLCIIQGIPYYYRQFGYAYALDHTPLTVLPRSRIPAPEGARAYALRPVEATGEDVNELVRLYDQAAAQHQISIQRSVAAWRYLLQHKGLTARMVQARESGRSVGYVVTSGRGSFLRVDENAMADRTVGLAILQQLSGEDGTELAIVGPSSDGLVRVARELGGEAQPVADQWLWRIPHIEELLHKLTPLFERRLQASGKAGHVGELCINLYREAFVLHIHRGQITVEAVGFVDASLGASGGDLNCPPDAFVRLLLGYRTLDALCDAWPDLRVQPAARDLLDILFPQLHAHILMPY